MVLKNKFNKLDLILAKNYKVYNKKCNYRGLNNQKNIKKQLINLRNYNFVNYKLKENNKLKHYK